MKREEIVRLVSKLSNSVFCTITDLVLWYIFYSVEISPLGSPTNLKKAEILTNKDLQRFNSSTLKRAIRRLKAKGFIKEDLTPTKEGRQRLREKFPDSVKTKQWNGDWHLVIYDIPQDKASYRDLLRRKLKRLGFGQLQASVWVSPFNFLGDVEQITEEYNISPHVILAISDKLGTEQGKELASKVWPLRKLNQRYQQLLEKKEEADQHKLYLEYLNILNQDPRLPKELLPEDWAGEKAHSLFVKFRKKLISQS